MSIDWYILTDGHIPVPCSDMDAIEAQRHEGNWIVAKTDIEDSHVSTVFLFLNHNWGDGPPVLFETLVFDGPMADHMERYRTWDEAEAGHERVCQAVRLAGLVP